MTAHHGGSALAAIAFSYISKSYPGVPDAVRSLTFDVGDGELFCLVGPSGCGKSTALRIVAGLESPDEGEIRIGGRVVNEIPTRKRDLGLVTQENALLRHRTAGGTVALPLELARRPRDEIDRRVRAEADALAVTALLDRKPRELSAGQAQAVQVARALVSRPRAFLLDEPLAKVGPALRLRIRADIVRLQRRYRVTTLWVTADQADAMAIADRLGVMIDGRLQQVGTPMEVHDRPRNLGVARFLGEPEMTILEARVRGAPGDLWFELPLEGDGGDLVRLRTAVPEAARYVKRPVLLGIRPHDVAGASREDSPLTGTVTASELLGSVTSVEVDLGRGVTVRTLSHRPGIRPGDRFTVGLPADRFTLFDPDTELAVHHP